MILPLNDPEVYGNYMPVRKGSMRVPDIAEGRDWNTLPDAFKTIEIEEYPKKCEMRRKAKIHRLTLQIIAKLVKTAYVSVDTYAGTTIGHELPEQNIGHNNSGLVDDALPPYSVDLESGRSRRAYSSLKKDALEEAHFNAYEYPRLPIELFPETKTLTSKANTAIRLPFYFFRCRTGLEDTASQHPTGPGSV